MTKKELDEIEARAKAGSDAPFNLCADGIWRDGAAYETFMDHAYHDLTALVAEVKRLQVLLDASWTIEPKQLSAYVVHMAGNMSDDINGGEQLRDEHQAEDWGPDEFVTHLADFASRSPNPLPYEKKND